MIFMDFQGSAGQEVSVVKGPAAGPTRKLASLSANGSKAPAVGPTRRLVIQAWIHGFS